MRSLRVCKVKLTQSRWQFAVLCLLFLLSRSVCGIDWQKVKPMYLISMFPPPVDNQDKHTPPTTAAVPNEDPMVLDLETFPLRDEMLPEGKMAMDRIFGGNVAHRHSFPYQVGMLLQRPKGLYWCGGSLISDEFVLTAAHCVDMAKRGMVFLGAHEIKNAKEVGQLRVMVPRTNFIIFPTWNPRRLKDDIALVRLPGAVDFTDRIHPIALPKRSYEYRNFKNKMAIASGWGRYASGMHAISNELRFVRLQVIDGHVCKNTFPCSYHMTNVCTSGRSAKSTCHGDSGGPLVLRRKSSKKRVLIGVTSFGSIYGCDLGYPAAFTKVAAYLDWISDETGIEPYQQTSNAMRFEDYLENYQHKTQPPEDDFNTEDFDFVEEDYLDPAEMYIKNEFKGRKKVAINRKNSKNRSRQFVLL